MKLWSKILVILIVIAIIGGAVAAAMGWIDVSRLIKVRPVKKGDSTVELREENKKLQERLALLEQQLLDEKELRQHLEQEVGAPQDEPPEGDQILGEKDYRELGNYYAGMKPPTAAAILGKMAPGVVAEILMGMDKEEAGGILAAMEHEMAVQVTEMIAGSAAQERDR